MHAAIKQATTIEDFNDARDLFRAYAAHLSFNPSGAASIFIDGFEDEVAGLPGPYTSPEGVILLAQVADGVAGCVALRPILPLAPVVEEKHNCEMKRLWIGERYRRLGLGRELVRFAISWAKAASYQAMYLDTAPSAMPAAQAMYQSLGFQQVERYNDNPVPGVIFFRLRLEGAATRPGYPQSSRLV